MKDPCTHRGHSGVRYREDVGFEMRCEGCAERNSGPAYWPMTLEYWHPRHGFKFCRACLAARDRAKARATRARDLDAARERDRKRYQRDRRVILLKRRAYYEANHETIRARANARYAARKREETA